ncbi:cell division control protein 6 homolog [Protopterus annectens]|uniref:cell division control protein 6 homolog n=1 Tax=Protopterus annectens TaxID=7888 RepID=UPI001CF95C37|nr:cell division control protein 6 homolog [Protopterus annectens]
MPSTRSPIPNTIQFPKKKSAVGVKSVVREKQSENLKEAPLPLSPKAKGLPLSPRKRLGDDNLCNIPQSLQCSPPKQVMKENNILSTLPPKGRRLVFENVGVLDGSPKKTSAETSPPRKGLETPQPDRKSPCMKLFKQDSNCYQQIKRALNTAIPERLLSRENETEIINHFLKDHVSGKKPGSLYISGAPGTGKTACLTTILNNFKSTVSNTRTICINCMSMRNSQSIFLRIAEELMGKQEVKSLGKELIRKLEKHLTSEGPMLLLILDEMDQLDSKGQDVLYTVFEWPWIPRSRLVLIGIANALDLTDRILPRLQARPKCKPQLLNFSPYTREQIIAILQDRLKQVSGDPILENSAIQFCARKVSAVSGDARKALDVCRRAVEVVESDVKSQTVLRPLSDCKSPSKFSQSLLVPKKVSLPHISRVISEVYGNRMTSGSGDSDETFPLQQKLLVCSLLLLMKESKVKEVTLGKLHETYCRVCRKQQMAAVDQSECLSLSNLLEARGILGLKKAKEARLTKISLKIEEKDVEYALKDKVLIGNILDAGL